MKIFKFIFLLSSLNVYFIFSGEDINDKSLMSQLGFLDSDKNKFKEKKNTENKKDDKVAVTFISSRDVLEKITNEILAGFIEQFNNKNGEDPFYNIQNCSKLQSHSVVLPQL